MNDPGKIHLIDPGFQPQHSGKCDLLLSISPSRFSYAVIDQAQDVIKVLSDDTAANIDEIETLLQTETIFNTHFHKIKVSLETSRFTFIPEALFDENNIADYAQFIQANISDLIVSDIRSAQVKNIFAADPRLKDILYRKFPGCKLTSPASTLIETALKFYSSKEKQLFLNFHGSSFEALILEDKKLIFYNIFEAETADDFNYYLLLILKQFEFAAAETVPIASGIIEISNENWRRLKKYFPAIRFADIGLFINQSDISQLISSHRFFSLAGLNLCE